MDDALGPSIYGLALDAERVDYLVQCGKLKAYQDADKSYDREK